MEDFKNVQTSFTDWSEILMTSFNHFHFQFFTYSPYLFISLFVYAFLSMKTQNTMSSNQNTVIYSGLIPAERTQNTGEEQMTSQMMLWHSGFAWVQ